MPKLPILLLVTPFFLNCVIAVDSGSLDGSLNLNVSPDGGWSGFAGDAGSGNAGMSSGGGGDQDAGGSPLTMLPHGPPGPGGATDGGTSTLPPFPGSGGRMGSLGVVWLVRIDRDVADLADTYEAFINHVNQLLAANGFSVAGTAIAPLYGGDGAFLYTSGGPYGASAMSISDALRYFAGQSSQFPAAACTSRNYFDLGSQTARAYWFVGGGPPYVRSNSLFADTPLVLLVGMIDSNARPYPLSDAACEQNGASPASLMSAAAWYPPFSDGPTLEPSQVRFVFVFTPEGNVSASDVRMQCLSDPGFPSSAVEAIAPSPAPFFTPLAQQLPNTSLALDLCAAPTQMGTDAVNSFIQQWVQSLIAGQPTW